MTQRPTYLHTFLTASTFALASCVMAATNCDDLSKLTLPQTAITTASSVAPGTFAPPASFSLKIQPGDVDYKDLPAFCRVAATMRPTSDSIIKIEVWLPPPGAWNGKFMAVGNGGFGGSIQGFGDMQTALRLGYATAGNDTGHSEVDGPNGMFALGHPEKIVDFAYRAMHEMTATSKKLIDKYYGSAPQFSYYKGCSTGGRQGAMNAQRYPEDFDGIMAGALANRHIQMHTSGTYRGIELARHPEGAIPEATAAFVTKAVLDKCDTLKEGFLNNPRSCTFDFKALACGSDASTATCLTPAQLATVERFYGGVKNSKGELIFSGQALGNPLPPQRAAAQPNISDTVRIWGFQNAGYDWKTFDLDRDMPIINSKVGFVDAVDPDLSKFKARGGKLLLYAGWGDTTITPENTVLYYENLQSKMGKNQDDWTRLFMVPGMGHCRGGDGPYAFDVIGTMEAWREKGVAPARITGFNPQSGLSRPLCPYPQYAKYSGTGNFKDAANWACTAP